MSWTTSLLDAYGRSAYPSAVPVTNTQLSRELYEATKDPTAFGWLDRCVLGPDGRPAGAGFVVKFTRYEELP